MAKTPERSKPHQFSNSLEWSQGLPQSRLVTPYANDLRDIKTIVIDRGVTMKVRADSPLLEQYPEAKFRRRIAPPKQESTPTDPEPITMDTDAILSYEIPDIPEIPTSQTYIPSVPEQKLKQISEQPIKKEKPSKQTHKDTGQKSESTKNIVLTAYQSLTEENKGIPPLINKVIQRTGLSKAAVYHHLRLLKTEGVIKTEKRAKSKTDLSFKQQNFLTVYQKLTQENNGIPPSTEQMADALGVGKNAVNHYFGFFRENGLISELPNAQEKIINILQINKGKPLSIKQLIEISGYKKATVYRSLRGLEDKDLLTYQITNPNLQSPTTPPEKSITSPTKVIQLIISSSRPYLSQQKRSEIISQASRLNPNSLMLAFISQGDKVDLSKLIETAQNIDSQHLDLNSSQLAKRFQKRLIERK